jgi:hypothetical protein
MATENRFLRQLDSSENSNESATESAPVNRFLGQLHGREIPKTEGIGKSVARTALQLPLGAAKRFTWPLDLLNLFAQGEAYSTLDEFDDARIAELKEKFPTAPWENFKGFDREKLLEAIDASLSIVPTQSNIERSIEQKTGIPLEPKTGTQKALRLGTTAASFRPGGVAPKVTAGVTAPVVSKTLEAAGVPEGISEFIGLGASAGVPSPSFSKIAKPSGLTTRRFEKLETPTKVSPARHEKITESIEQDFRKIGDQLLSKNKTYSAIKEDPLFKEKVSGLFDEVDKLAENVEGTISPGDLRDTLREKAAERSGKGISPNEYERAYRKEIKRLTKEIPYNPIQPKNGVDQFRKNNKSLGEYFEPGKSSAHNRAKRDALLDYNRAIADSFEQNYPGSEFEKLFRFTNKRWQEISDVESATEFIDGVFDGKINYGKAKQLFNRDKEHVSRPFQRLLGDEGFKEFKSLTEDLLSSEKAYSMLKKAGAEGNKDLLALGLEYVIHPKIAATHVAGKLAKRLYQSALDKPQIAVEWKSALDALKKGDFAQAEKRFRDLDKIAKETKD